MSGIEGVWSRKILPRMQVDSNGCWLFTGKLSTAGYGLVWIEGTGRFYLVHRISAHLHHGLALSDVTTFACHTCDVRACFNPSHLFLGTGSDNMRDAVAKGRARVGGEPQDFCDKGHELRLTRVRYATQTFCGVCRRERRAVYMRGYRQRQRAA